MKRFVKALALAFAVLLLGMLAAGTWFALTFNPDVYRGRVAALVREATGRELAIDGDVTVTLLPSLAVEVGAVRLAQREGFGTPPFASVSRADADIRLLPLLFRGDVEVGRLHLERLTVELRRAADGTTNWGDLGPQIVRAAGEDAAGGTDATAESPAAGGKGRVFRIGAAEIEGASVRYVDERAQREITLREGALRTGSFALGEPFAVETRFRLQQGDSAAEVQGRGRAVVAAGALFELRDAAFDIALADTPSGAGALDVRFEVPSARYEGADLRLEKPRVQIKSAGGGHIRIEGVIAMDAIALSGGDALELKAPAVELALDGDSVPGGRARLEAHAPLVEASLEGQTLRMDEMSGEVYGVTFSASATGARRDAPALAGRIAVAPFSPRVLMEKVGHAPAATADPQAFTHAQLDAHYVLDATGMRLHDIKATLDDTALSGELVVTDLARGAVRFDLVADRLVLDRYLAPAAVRAGAGAGAFTLTSEDLRALDVAGSLRVADLTLAGLHSTDARLRAERADDPAAAPAPGAGTGAALAGAADD